MGSLEQSLFGSFPQFESTKSTESPEFTEFTESLESQTVEAAFSTQEVRQAAKISLDFLAGLVAPTAFIYNFPPLLKLAWQMLCESANKPRDFSRLALGIPRGFAKTTLLKLFVVWTILFTRKKFILIISNTELLAINFLSDVADMLDEVNLKKSFGDWRLGSERDSQQVKKFGFMGRSIALVAISAGTSLRGLNLGNERPDVMIFDDIQTREEADSEALSADLLKWMVGTAMKAASPQGCLYVFIGNMYPTPHSILKKLKYNPEWISFIVGGILADGTSLWEELKPVKQLLAEYRGDAALGQGDIFAAEVLNDEFAAVNNKFDLSAIPLSKFDLNEPEQGSFIIIDPSGDKKFSDHTAIGHIKVYDGIPVLAEVISERLSPLATIQEALKLAMRTQTSLIVVESVQYQASLLYWFNHMAEQVGLTGIEFQPIYPGRTSKNARIRDAYLQLVKGEIQLSEQTRPYVLSELGAWRPLRSDNKDNVLDICAYSLTVLAAYGELMTLRGQMISYEAELSEVLEADVNTPF